MPLLRELPDTRFVARLAAALAPTDILVIGFALLLSLVSWAVLPAAGTATILVPANLLACGLVVTLALARRGSGSAVLRALHAWYPVPLVFLAFKEMHLLVGPLHGGRDYDELLIAADRLLFGVDPTVWMTRFAHPLITEILQIAYTSFYFLFLLLGMELYRRTTAEDFRIFMFTCVYGFFLSYLGYVLLPAVGPRFILHDFAALDRELPGVLLTPWLRWFVNAGGSVPMNVPNDVAMAAAQRDVFPSGHTMMTLVLMSVARVTRARVAPLLYVVGSLLIVATVYQRYHYVVDLLAGALFAMICLATVRPLYRFLCRVLSVPA